MDVLWFNGRWTTTDEPVVRVEDRGLQFGDSIYEVLKFRRRAPLLAERHFARLQRCLTDLEIPPPWHLDAFLELLRELLDRTDLVHGLIYLQVTRGVAPRAHAWGAAIDPTALAYARAFEFPSAERMRDGIGLVSMRDNRWERRDLKTTNLLANVFAKNHAMREKAGEALYVDDGFVTECASSSFFAVLNGALVTREDGIEILPGTVRDAVIELAQSDGIEVRRRPIALHELESATELFVTSTSLGVMPVSSIDASLTRARGPVTERLQQLLTLLEEDTIDRWWLVARRAES
ncbi:MAG: aminotransferase class IV [Acidobacteria bacterium]|nr:aminotransferase class IV [Acidobacteriota bacterium]